MPVFGGEPVLGLPIHEKLLLPWGQWGTFPSSPKPDPLEDFLGTHLIHPVLQILISNTRTLNSKSRGTIRSK